MVGGRISISVILPDCQYGRRDLSAATLVECMALPRLEDCAIKNP